MAFSTANEDAFHDEKRLAMAEFVPNAQLDRMFQAVIQAIDEAIMNAIFANETMEGFQGSRVEGLPVEEVMSLLKEYKAI
jgi:D-aminopeptidase